VSVGAKQAWAIAASRRRRGADIQADLHWLKDDHVKESSTPYAPFIDLLSSLLICAPMTDAVSIASWCATPSAALHAAGHHVAGRCQRVRYLEPELRERVSGCTDTIWFTP
jgi:hypothetical protein